MACPLSARPPHPPLSSHPSNQPTLCAHRQVVERYPYVAMDTEFPGVVARPVGDVTAADYQYKTLKCNVDLLKVGLLFGWGGVTR